MGVPPGNQPRVSAKFDLSYKSLKRKFNLILFAYSLMIGYSTKRIEKIVRESAVDKNKKKPGLKFNPWLVLTGVRTTGPRKENKNGADFSFA